MKLTIVALLAGTTISLAGCAKHDNADNAAADTNIAMDGNVVAPAADPNSAQGMANAAAASDRFEIETSRLAQASASSAAVKKFAAQMIAAHTESTAKLKSLAGTMSPALTIDDTLSAEQQSTLDGLKAQTGAGFDSAYKQAQVDGHQKTLDLLKAYASGGDNAALKGFAQGMVPKVTAHLNTAKGLK